MINAMRSGDGWRAALLALLALVFAAPAKAQTSPLDGWQMTVGVGVRGRPSYEGSDRFAIAFRPIISFGRSGAIRGWRAEDDPISIGLISGDAYRFGVAAQFIPSRSGADDKRLRGLRKVPFGVEVGGFGEIYPLNWLRARVDLRHAIRGHEGMVAELKLDAFTDPNERWSFGIGPRARLVSTRYVERYFAVSPAEAAVTGLAPYRPTGGLHSVGALAQGSYRWTNNVRSTAYVKYDYLLGGASRAPIVKSPLGTRHQLELGLSTSWTLDLSR